jgi:hypothetical protein
VIQAQVSLKFIFSPRLMILGILLHNLKMICRVLHDPSLTLTSEPSNDAEKRKIQKCIICTELQTNQKRLRKENYKMHNL